MAEIAESSRKLCLGPAPYRTDEEMKNFTAAAKAKKQTISEWMLSILNSGIEV